VSAAQEGGDDLAAYRRNVGLFLIGPGARVFAGERIDTPGAWQMPQGGIDKGEDPLAAALRELGEETGVAPALVETLAESADWLRYDLPPDVALKLWKGRFRGQAQKWFAFRFLGSDADVTIQTEHPEFSTWGWLAPDELMGLIVPFKRPVYERVFAEFAPLLR
jgi:putative (di)nucleoside polyphosphate hydrolase